MKKFLKWFFGILFFLVLLLVGAVLAIPYLVDPNEYKDEIIAQAQPYMKGRDLKIPGDIKISIVPWLGFEIGEVVVGNAEGFVLKPFATIKKSRAHVRLWPLLFKEIEIDTMEIHGLVMNLQSDAEGRNNWSDLAAAETPSYFIKTAAPAAKTEEPMTLPSLKIQGVHLKNAQVNFDDRQSKTDIKLYKMDIDAGPINLLNPVPVRGKFNYHSKSQGITAASALATTVTLTPASQFVQLDELVINTNISGDALSGKQVSTSLKVPALKVDLAKETVEARPLHLQLDEYKSEGRFKLSNFKKPAVQFTLEMQELNLDKILPPPSEADAKVAAAAAVAPVPADEAVLAPLAVLKDTDLQGTIKINKLLVRKLQIDKLRVNMLARGGLVSFLPDAKLYGGSYTGDAQINVKKTPISVRTKHKLEDVDLGPIVEALTGKPTLTGNARIQAQYFTEGNTGDDMLKNLNGDTQFNIRNADARLLDAEKLILGDLAGQLNLDKKQDPKKEVTVFDSIRGSIRVKSGVAYNKDLSAISKRVHVTGKGHAILFKQEIDYTLYHTFKKSVAISLGSASYDLKDKKIPIHIRGTFSEPIIDLDIEEVLKQDLLGGRLEKEKARLQEKIDQKKAEEKAKLDNKIEQKKEEEKTKVKDKLKNELERFLKR